MLCFPTFNEINSQQKVVVGGGFSGAINHTHWCNHMLSRNGVGCIVWQVPARHPVHRRIKVRARVFTTRKIIPVPTGTALVIVRYLLNAKRPTLAHFGRQGNRWNVRTQKLCEIHHTHIAGTQGRGQPA